MHAPAGRIASFQAQKVRSVAPVPATLLALILLSRRQRPAANQAGIPIYSNEVSE
jgi:hypothetical protein